MNHKKITLDTERKSFESIIAMQGDNKSRYIDATIVNRSVQVDLTGCAVKFSAIKPDITDIFNDAVIIDAKGGKVQIELTNQTLAVPGVIQATLVILKEDMQLSVLPFFITVIENPYNPNAIESKPEYQALNNALIVADGYAKELQDASVNLEEKYTTRLNNFGSQLDKIKNVELPNLDKKRHKITRATKKIFDDATVININNTGKQAEICGFRSKEQLANYADRDSAIMYVDGTLPNCLILEVINFTVDSVQVIGDTSSIEVGMVIDCMNQSEFNPFNQATKYSGFVTEVNGQNIKVSGWYQLGNTASGQIPNKDRIIVNPITKLWTMNSNIFLNADSFGWGGVIAEYGMFNRKSVATGNENYRLSGIDLINYGGVCEYGYSIRNNDNLETTKTKVGFKGDKTLQNYRSTNAKEVGYFSLNDNIGFYANQTDSGFRANVGDTASAFHTENNRFNVTGFGTIKNLMLNRKVYGANSTIAPYDAFLHIVGSGTHTLPSPSSFPYANIKILAQTDVTINGAMFTNTGDITTKSLGAWRTLELYSDGAKWYIIF